MRIALIDVDDTLWGFCSTLLKLGKQHGINLPSKNELGYWDAIFKYESPEKVIPLFDEIHSQQSVYKPYADAKYFLETLKSHGDKIVIVSHRNPKFKSELEKWLVLNELPFDDIVITNDKKSLFSNPDVKIVVDDRADTICSALAAEKIGMGLKRPWNSTVCYNGNKIPVFKSLTEIIVYLKKDYMSDNGDIK